MTTKRIFRTNVYCREISAAVTAVCDRNGCDTVVCDTTVFFPTGGGQPCDTGTIDGYAVTDVFDESLDGDVFHVTDAPSGTFHIGDTVKMCIDWDRRFRNMQRHLGEHILSGVFHSMYGGANRGFHMGSDYTAIDIDTDGRPLTQEMADAAERRANEIIQSDAPVTVDYFDSPEAASRMPVRKPITAKGRISIVTVGNAVDPFDCCACCGTHPSTAGQVGVVKIYKIEPNKGMTRVFFDAGMNALDRIDEDMKLLRAVTDRYSAGRGDLMHKLDISDEKDSELRAHASALSGIIRDQEVSEISDFIAAHDNPCCILRRYDILDPDDLVKIGFACASAGHGSLIALAHMPSDTVLLFSDGSYDCGSLVKEHAFACGGRGGGRKDNARAVFSERRAMDSFIAELGSAAGGTAEIK